jgi:hypothetical protein
MGNLTVHLQNRFIECCPPGWIAHREVRLLSPELEQWFGYQARADILLERPEQQRRLWIEFEVSRADPVANHAKFATTHLFLPQAPGDVFIAMVSSHVTRGRANLAANTIGLMRRVGMEAFQTTLLPSCSGEAIKRLNHLTLNQLAHDPIDVQPEFERALQISEPLYEADHYHLYFVGNLLELMLNLREWNAQIITEEGSRLWGRRTITYFVHDPDSRAFAPSKFCAYLAVPKLVDIAASLQSPQPTATGLQIAEYLKLHTDSRFDGARARVHLEKHLAMQIADSAKRLTLMPVFEDWLRDHADFINLHPNGPQFLIPPLWYS